LGHREGAPPENFNAPTSDVAADGEFCGLSRQEMPDSYARSNSDLNLPSWKQRPPGIASFRAKDEKSSSLTITLGHQYRMADSWVQWMIVMPVLRCTAPDPTTNQ
jgi:hypothetical protein